MKHLLGSYINASFFFFFAFKELTAIMQVSRQKILGLQDIRHVILLSQTLIPIVSG